MASTDSESFAPVLAALSVMQSNVERSQKTQAHDYLEKFQKSVGFGLVVSYSFTYIGTHWSRQLGLSHILSFLLPKRHQRQNFSLQPR